MKEKRRFEMIDYTPTSETISLHELGFIQVIMPNKYRLHAWHPELPRRKCYPYSPIHNHRFSFQSEVLRGMQINQRVRVVMKEKGEFGSHVVIAHQGPRSAFGGRESFVDGFCDIELLDIEYYKTGQNYIMTAGEYHHTPNSGRVVTLMEKLYEGEIHANSIILGGHEFDQSFDRFQFSPEKLWEFVQRALTEED
jgi:hypothetical protein